MPDHAVFNWDRTQRDFANLFTIAFEEKEINKVRVPLSFILVYEVFNPHGMVQKGIAWNNLEIKRHWDPRVLPHPNVITITHPPTDAHSQ